ncbi:MAG: hypothetical protein SW833_05920 [Cyanobacteriota bacterium]|nr:hypothetical protein [Cyanobacteriota bacterium]
MHNRESRERFLEERDRLSINSIAEQLRGDSTSRSSDRYTIGVRFAVK